MNWTLCFFLISSFIPVTSGAVETTPTTKLSWAEYLRKTREANEELKSAERTLEASEYQTKGSYSNFFPQISATAAATRGTNNEDYTVSLSASQNLFAGFQDSGKVDQAKANLDLARNGLQSTRAKISYDLKTALADLVYAQDYMKLTESILRRRELNLRMVQLRFDGGRENKGSLLLSKAYLEEARLDRLQAQQDLKVAQARVGRVLGAEDGEAYVLEGKIPVSEPLPEDAMDFRKLVLETPAYKNTLAQENLSKASLTQAESNFYPSLNLVASAAEYGPTWYPDQNRWSVGATLTLPLFNGGRDYFATRGALESLKASAFSRGNILKDQTVKLKDAYVSYAQSVQRLKVDEAYVQAAEAREKISRQKYNNGLANFDDWDVIESELIKRQKNLLVSQKDRVASEALWEQMQGRGVLP